MFYIFFYEYKQSVYKGSRHKPKRREIIIFLILLFIPFVLLFFNALNFDKLLSLCLLGVDVVMLMILWIQNIQEMRKNKDSLLCGYEEKHIVPLINLLTKYKLLSNTGIDWLIECCQGKKLKSQSFPILSVIKFFFISIIYPTMNLALGLILKDSDSKTITTFIIKLVVVYIAGGLAILAMQPFALFVMFPDKSIVECLEENLKYIKSSNRVNQQQEREC